jgi:hypothetical protein
LPEELIAQEPPENRGGSRMLLLDRATGAWRDDVFAHFPEQLRAGDVLVLNDSRVIPARLYGSRMRRSDEDEPMAGRIEVLLTEQIDIWEWNALVKPGRKLRVGDGLEFAGDNDVALHAEIVAAGEHGVRTLRFAPVADFDLRLDALGHMPLPPYIHREDRALDRERYQTVYARPRGSAAAPTAGLHFTPQLRGRKGLHDNAARWPRHLSAGARCRDGTDQSAQRAIRALRGMRGRDQRGAPRRPAYRSRRNNDRSNPGALCCCKPRWTAASPLRVHQHFHQAGLLLPRS